MYYYNVLLCKKNRGMSSYIDWYIKKYDSILKKNCLILLFLFSFIYNKKNNWNILKLFSLNLIVHEIFSIAHSNINQDGIIK